MPVFNGFTPVQRSSDACILSCLRENNNPFRSIHYIQRTHLKKFLSISLSLSVSRYGEIEKEYRPSFEPFKGSFSSVLFEGK